MDPFHKDNETASVYDEKMNNIFMKFAEEFDKEEDFLLPLLSTPVNSPPIDFGDLPEPETIKQSEIKEEPILESEGGIFSQPIKVVESEAFSSEQPLLPTENNGGSYQVPVGEIENMIENASTSGGITIPRQVKKKEYAARSREKQKARDFQMKTELENLKNQNLFEKKVLSFLSGQNTKLNGGKGKDDGKRFLSASI